MFGSKKTKYCWETFQTYPMVRWTRVSSGYDVKAGKQIFLTEPVLQYKGSPEGNWQDVSMNIEIMPEVKAVNA